MNNTEMNYIEAVLTNDETSTDNELIDLFMKELNLNHRQAVEIVLRRNYYLKHNIDALYLRQDNR